MLKYDENIYRAIFEPDTTSPASTIPERLSAVHPLTVYDNLPFIYEDCEAVQRKVLSEILERAQGTVYADDHGLNGVHTLEAWRSAAKTSLYPDYQSYIVTQQELSNLYATDKRTWNQKSLRNIAAAGYFAADRSIRDYAENIWNMKPLRD